MCLNHIDKFRFLTRDPIGYGGGINLYAYCQDDPIGNVDPLGLDVGDDFINAMRSIVDAAAPPGVRQGAKLAYIVFGDNTFVSTVPLVGPALDPARNALAKLCDSRDELILSHFLSADGYDVHVAPHASSADILKVLRDPSVGAFIYIGHSLGPSVLRPCRTEEDPDPALGAGAMGEAVGPVKLNLAMIFACYSAQDDCFKINLVGPTGAYFGSEGFWFVPLAVDLGKLFHWPSSVRAKKRRAGP